jgi:tRNA pseudouridine13 synthase
VIVKPKDLKHEIINYEHELDEISKSDWDLLRPQTNENTEPRCKSNEPQAGKHKALQIEFSLPSSSYATIALREILQ